MAWGRGAVCRALQAVPTGDLNPGLWWPQLWTGVCAGPLTSCAAYDSPSLSEPQQVFMDQELQAPPGLWEPWSFNTGKALVACLQRPTTFGWISSCLELRHPQYFLPSFSSRIEMGQLSLVALKRIFWGSVIPVINCRYCLSLSQPAHPSP